MERAQRKEMGRYQGKTWAAETVLDFTTTTQNLVPHHQSREKQHYLNGASLPAQSDLCDVPQRSMP
jgi:hypothetical protein